MDAVIWATGSEFDHAWIEPAVKDENGAIQHRRGATPVPGLYFSGCPGSTRADQRSPTGSRMTPNTSLSRSRRRPNRPRASTEPGQTTDAAEARRDIRRRTAAIRWEDRRANPPS